MNKDDDSVDKSLREKLHQDNVRSVSPTDIPEKRSASEAFMELSNEIQNLRSELAENTVFVQLCKDKFNKHADEYRFDGMRPVLESLIQLHDLLFCQLMHKEKEDGSLEAFTKILFEMLESELSSHLVRVIEPRPGEEVNLEVMTTIGTESCPFWNKPGRVGKVNSCGFVFRANSGEPRVLRKAVITVYQPD